MGAFFRGLFSGGFYIWGAFFRGLLSGGFLRGAYFWGAIGTTPLTSINYLVDYKQIIGVYNLPYLL